MIAKTLSRPYAKAAFNFSKKNFVIYKWYNMLNFCSKLYCHNSMKSVINCNFEKKKFEKFFMKICKYDIDLNFNNFIKILVEDNKLYLLKDIKNMFYYYWKIRNRIIDVIIYSSKKLSKKFISNVLNIIKKKFSKKIFLKNILDKSIIYGFIIKIDDKIFDNSFNYHLYKLRKYMLNVF
ncbi:F0F1 ATP synthase subunit delta [Buchnera aphidicola (Ceratovacuna keduensis)]|uniref:F0F1 ATP synthase subunit delta n=1 Tax=Buchnera aphidicola TaxID=9 RepID=UPI0031B8AE0D